ncbi:MAG: hypothetical protein AB2L14_33325 [Candidatus Xenobiia bacterium LiM19]
MLKAIVNSGKKVVTREYLLDLLWSDNDSDKALQSFKFTLHQIHRLNGNDTVLQHKDVVMLNYEICWSDLSWDNGSKMELYCHLKAVV